MIPGHPGPGDRLGTRKDAEDQLQFLQDASAEMKVLAQNGKCWEPAEKEFKLPKYESWPGYANGMPFVARRYCGLWGRGTCSAMRTAKRHPKRHLRGGVFVGRRMGLHCRLHGDKGEST